MSGNNGGRPGKAEQHAPDREHGGKTADTARKYEPIDCAVHDRLIERATFRLPTEITYRNERGELVVTRDLIEDVFARDGAEYLRLASGTEIRLDKIAGFGDG